MKAGISGIEERKGKKKMNVLIIRFRQMGDAIIATSLCNTIRHNFPDARIDIVLNENIAPLFAGHPSIDRIISFNEAERHSFTAYLKKVAGIVKDTKYDVIIDMRSTANTMLFALLSPFSKFRIGLKKPYTRIAFNHVISFDKTEDMVERDIKFAKPLEKIKHIEPQKRFSLHINDSEKHAFRGYMADCGIDFCRRIMLASITAKLENKTWNEENMVWVLRKFSAEYPDTQIIFNYAPGKEEENARRIYDKVENRNIFIDVKARSSRELAAMSSLVTFYFGNEGGARHIVHAMGKPSFVICSPKANKHVWLPQNEILSQGIEAADIVSDSGLLNSMSYEQKYEVMTKEIVWDRFHSFCKALYGF